MIPLCSLKNLSLSFPHKTIFKQVNFTINYGDRIGVLGLNGHGKSSLFKIIAGKAAADTTTPPFVFDKAQNFSFFYVPQELPNIQGVKVEDYFYEFYPEFAEINQKIIDVEMKLSEAPEDMDSLIEKQAKLYEEADRLGMHTIHDAYTNYLKSFRVQNQHALVSDLSGGEQRKIALALGLSAKQELILWDEPTNHLDLATIEAFEDELLNSSKTYMIISHDRSLLNNVVEKVFHIEKGQLKSFDGTYAQYLEYLNEEEARHLKEIDRLSNVHRRETAWIRRGAKARRTKSKKRIADYGSLESRIKELQAKSSKELSLDLQGSDRKSKQLVKAENISFSYRDKGIFQDISFSVKAGDKIGLLGTNGSGKTTLLKLVTGELNASSGKLERVGDLKVGFFSQKREALKEDKTPWQLIGEGSDFIHTNTGERRHVASYLEGFLFTTDEIKRPLHTFSGGEKNRLQLALFMKDAMDLWIFDEPTNDLDLETIGILEEELKSYKGAVIVVCHDRTFIDNVTQKCWLVDEGHLEFFTGLEQVQEFIEIRESERSLKESQPVRTVSLPVKDAKKDKKRLVEVESLIEKGETRLKKIQSELDNFDYSGGMNPEKKNLLLKLEAQKKDAKKELDKYFAEWEELNS